MDNAVNSCLDIIKNCNLKIDIDKLTKLKTNKFNFFQFLFANLDKTNLDKLILHCCLDKTFTPILYTHFAYLCTHISPNTTEVLFEYLVNNQIEPTTLLDMVQINTTSLEQYKRIISFLKSKVPSYSLEFEKQYHLLYELKEKIEDSSDNCSFFSAGAFEKLVIFPLSRTNGNEYLNYALKQLKIESKKIEFMENGKGTFSWCFKANDLVLKLSYKITTWNIPMFYRINDFVIRKKFDSSIITVSPYGDIDSVSNMDIHDVLNDFDKANLVLTDGNYRRNFGVVDYEIPDTMFRDVDGITEHLDIKKSRTFKKKKAKLIDQDFIYFKNDKDKVYGAPEIFK